MPEPRLPVGAALDNLAGNVAVLGWPLGGTISKPRPVRASSFRTWVKRALNGEQPYRTWYQAWVICLAYWQWRVAAVQHGEWDDDA